MILPKDLFTVGELATRWDCSEEDVMHQVEAYRLSPSFRFSGRGFRYRRLLENGLLGPLEFNPDDFRGFTPSQIEELKKGYEKDLPFRASYILMMRGQEVEGYFSNTFPMNDSWAASLDGIPFPMPKECARPEDKDIFMVPTDGGYVNKRDILFQLEEIERFEIEHSETKTTADKSPPGYLDPDHQYYSEELAAAVKVWTDLYGKGNIKTNRSHKEQIKAGLAGYRLSNAAIERVVTLVNPKKQGGMPPTD